MDGEVPFENEVAAVFDLIDGVVAFQIHRLPFLLGKLGAQQPTPIVQPLLDDGSTQLVGSRLERLRV
jgi:hypothetical protein